MSFHGIETNGKFILASKYGDLREMVDFDLWGQFPDLFRWEGVVGPIECIKILVKLETIFLCGFPNSFVLGAWIIDKSP